jgi:transcription antitermination factor NusG
VYVPKRVFRPSLKRVTNPRPRRAPLLVGYVLVRFPSALLDRRGRPQFGVVVDCKYVTGPYVCYFDKRGDRIPMPLTADDVGDLMGRQRNNEFNEIAVAHGEQWKRIESLRSSMKKGEPVLIIDGPFAGHVATLVQIEDDGSAVVKVSLIGRESELLIADAARQLDQLAKSSKTS